MIRSGEAEALKRVVKNERINELHKKLILNKGSGIALK